MATRQANLSALGTSSVLDALSSDHSDVELSPPSEPEYDDVSETTSNSAHRTDSEQGNELEMNRSSAASVPSLLSVLRAPKLSDLTRKRKIQCNPGKRKKIRSNSSTSSDPSIDVLQWWKQNESALPCWASAARKVLLVQSSSAASERVLSLLKSSFSSQQQSSLQDYIETSLMLQYNIC